MRLPDCQMNNTSDIPIRVYLGFKANPTPLVIVYKFGHLIRMPRTEKVSESEPANLGIPNKLTSQHTETFHGPDGAGRRQRIPAGCNTTSTKTHPLTYTLTDIGSRTSGPEISSLRGARPQSTPGLLRNDATKERRSFAPSRRLAPRLRPGPASVATQAAMLRACCAGGGICLADVCRLLKVGRPWLASFF